MENKSITELTELLIKYVDMIDRKNEALKHASDKFRDLDKLSIMCKGIKFESAESASEFMSVMANTLRKLSYERFDLLDEAKIEVPKVVKNEEPAEVQPVAEQPEVTEDDLPFC